MPYIQANSFSEKTRFLSYYWDLYAAQYGSYEPHVAIGHGASKTKELIFQLYFIVINFNLQTKAK